MPEDSGGSGEFSLVDCLGGDGRAAPVINARRRLLI
jgi:hypothetical protein